MAGYSDKSNWIFIEVLQNGVPVTTAKRPWGKTASLAISNDKKDQLVIPFYKSKINTTILKVSRNTAELNLNLPWVGYVNQGGQLITLTADPDVRLRTFVLSLGDYASIHHGDLRVIIRSGRDLAPSARATK